MEKQCDGNSLAFFGGMQQAPEYLETNHSRHKSNLPTVILTSITNV